MAPAVRAGHELLAGGAAGAVARFCVAPLDVVKIRFQLQTKAICAGGGATYTSIPQALKAIWQREGIIGLWRGNLTAEFLCAGYTGVQFSVVDSLRPWFEEILIDHGVLASFLSGALGGAVATASSYPLDLMRTRFAGQGVPRAFHSYGHLIGTVWRQHGIIGFYAGILPALISMVPHMGVTFAFYNAVSRFCPQLSARPDFQMASGMAAGAVARIVTHPLDTLKKRVQMLGVERHAVYGESMPHAASCVEALQLVIRLEGPMALYRGLLPSLLKNVPVTGITFVVHDQILLWLRDGA